MSEDRSVVLIHGVSSSRLTWWRNAQDLTDLHWRVQTVDLLGHGDRADRGNYDLRVDDRIHVDAPEGGSARSCSPI